MVINPVPDPNPAILYVIAQSNLASCCAVFPMIPQQLGEGLPTTTGLSYRICEMSQGTLVMTRGSPDLWTAMASCAPI